MYSASIVYKRKNSNELYITFLTLPGNKSDGHDEYFAKQVCFRYGWEHVASKMETNPSRHVTKDEKSLGYIRKTYEFFTKKGDKDL